MLLLSTVNGKTLRILVFILLFILIIIFRVGVGVLLTRKRHPAQRYIYTRDPNTGICFVKEKTTGYFTSVTCDHIPYELIEKE